MKNFATIDDVTRLFRALNPDEIERVEALLPIVSDSLRQEADKVGKDLDEIASQSESYASVVKSVVVDVIGRTLQTSTNSEPMTQFNQSALGYSVGGTFLNPGGGLFIKRDELKRLGLRQQKMGAMDIYGIND